MNNSNGDALLARVKAGNLVTVRAIGGELLTGRAKRTRSGMGKEVWAITTGPHTSAEMTAGNIVRVRP
jgi:hypothetical protein